MSSMNTTEAMQIIYEREDLPWELTLRKAKCRAYIMPRYFEPPEEQEEIIPWLP